jgi:hypothetical protein
MKNRKFWLGIILTILVFGIALVGCKTDTDPTFTVWTDTVTYSEFTSAFQTTLNDGYYARVEFTGAQWNQISPTLTNEGKFIWTESQIKNWFIGRGFGNTEANRETAWLMSINHGFLASRTGSLVYMILK